MLMRAATGLFSLTCFVFLTAPGCDSPPAAPPATNPTDSSTAADDHDHGHDHDHGDEHADADKHDHEHEHADEHAHPETYAAAVAEIDELRAAVEKASAGGDVSKADSELHDIGHLLEELNDLAEKEAMTDAARAKLKEAVESLMDAFMQVDAKIHGKEGKAYDEVADNIDAAMTVLKSSVAGEK